MEEKTNSINEELEWAIESNVDESENGDFLNVEVFEMVYDIKNCIKQWLEEKQNSENSKCINELLKELNVVEKIN